MPLVVVGHGSGAALLQGQARLGAIKRLDLALLVDREHDRVRRRIDIKPDHVAELRDELRIIGELELPHSVRLKAVSAPDALDGADGDRRVSKRSSRDGFTGVPVNSDHLPGRGDAIIGDSVAHIHGRA